MFHTETAMIGTSYFGLVSGVCFSDFGHDVICIDKVPTKIVKLNVGEAPIYDPILDDRMAKNVAAGLLSSQVISIRPSMMTRCRLY